MIARLIVFAGILGVVGWPTGAEAHLVTTGLGPVYDGLLHFVLTPEDLLPALALALLAGVLARVAGSWIAAIGLLLLGWGLCPAPSRRRLECLDTWRAR